LLLFSFIIDVIIEVISIELRTSWRTKCKKCMGSTTGCGDCNRQQPGAKSKNQRDNRNNTVKINKRKR